MYSFLPLKMAHKPEYLGCRERSEAITVEILRKEDFVGRATLGKHPPSKTIGELFDGKKRMQK